MACVCVRACVCVFCLCVCMREGDREEGEESASE